MTQWLYDYLIRRPIQALSILACLGFVLIVMQFSSIAEKIRYPALARANNWQGKVLLQLALDQNGRLLGLAVRLATSQR